MRRTLLLTVALIALTAPAQAADIAGDSRITAATVYTDRASVTRELKVELPAGASTVVVANLPITLFPDSLRAEGSASAAVTLGAIENRQVAGAELTAPRERELNDRLLALTDGRQAAQAEITALEARKAFLNNLGKQAGLRADEEIAELNLKPDQWNGAAVAIQAGLADALKQQAAQTIALRNLDKQVQQVQTELGQLQTGQRNSYTVRVPVEAKTATVLTLKITYQLPQATWRPIYDARLETGGGKLALTQYGEVHQQTGEDWTDVVLTLSTAQPARGAVPPLLSTMWVDIQQPEVYNYNRRNANKATMAPQSLSRLSADGTDAAEVDELVNFSTLAEPVAAVFQGAAIETGGYVSEYKISGPANVPADNSGKKLMISQLDTSAALVVQARPQLTTEAFLIARTKLNGEAPLLPGQAALFRDGAFIGSAAMPLLRPGEETDLGFGIDDQVVVKHRALADQRGETGVISKNKTLARKFETTVQNLHSFPASIEVLETVPVVRNENIKIDLQRETTAGYAKDVNDVTGLYKWSLKVEPQKKEAVILSWQLSWPNENEISGVP